MKSKSILIVVILILLGLLVHFNIARHRTSSSVIITQISPSSGRIGDSIMVAGSGFSSKGNTVFFNSSIEDVDVPSDGKTLTFSIGTVLAPDCRNGNACPNFEIQMSPRQYSVTIENSGGVRSDPVEFTVLSGGEAPAANKFVPMPNATVGVMYSRSMPGLSTLVSGKIPEGMQIGHPCHSADCNQNEYALFGTPKVSGTYDFAVKIPNTSIVLQFELIVVRSGGTTK